MTGRIQEIPAWDSLNADEKKLYARQMEAFAAQLEHVDFQIGRVVESLERIAGDEVTPEALHACGLIKNTRIPVKLLGNGSVDRALTVKDVTLSGSARKKITDAGISPHSFVKTKNIKKYQLERKYPYNSATKISNVRLRNRPIETQ